MIKNILSAFGRHPGEHLPEDYDVVCGHSFGTSTDEHSVNSATAFISSTYALGKPIVIDRSLADAFSPEMQQPDYVIGGEISNTLGNGVGAWGTLHGLQDYMETNDLHKALMIGQRNLIGRVLMQAEVLGIPATTTKYNSVDFDKKSEQWWTRSLPQWLIREIPGSIVLRRQKKL